MMSCFDADHGYDEGGGVGLIAAISGCTSGMSASTFLGRPRFARVALDTWDLGLANLRSLKCLNSKIGSPLTLHPTFIFTTDFEIRSTTGNGPAKLA